jgi:hypothetical protein
MTDLIAEKQRQFNEAMEKYENIRGYLRVGRVVSFINVGSQIFLAILVFRQSIGPFRQLLVLAAAYVLTDFVNGLVHMYMDNNDDYRSAAGPLIASFHLHHRTPRYKQNPIPLVYYNESGSKIWLAFVNLAAVAGVLLGAVNGVFAYGLLYFSVLSSLAEVSHYLCHTPQPKLARVIGYAGILLSSRRHLRHHTQDNVSYAFLNGMTNPILDVIAKLAYPGYKNTTDLHYARYAGTGTENREG